MKVCFTASSGGHFEQLMMLRPLMEKYDGFIVTEATGYSVDTGFKTYELMQVNRRQLSFIPRMLYNAMISVCIFVKERPDAVVSVGVLATIPICLICKVTGKRLIYIESFAKITSPTETGAFIYRLADRFYVQWEQMLDVYPKATFAGSVY